MKLVFALYGITALFFIIFFIRFFLSEKKRNLICSICLAATLTWIYLLIFLPKEKLITALLMGITLLGIFYTVENNVKRGLKLFRLPFLVTLITIGYYLLTLQNIAEELFFSAVLWILFFITYCYRKKPRFKKLVGKIIECCKEW